MTDTLAPKASSSKMDIASFGPAYRKVYRLRKRGWKNPQIAKALNMSVDSVGQLAHILIQSGLITPHKKGRPRGRTKANSWINLSDSQTKQVIALKKRRYNSNYIAEQVGVTSQAIRLMCKALIETYGQALLEPWTNCRTPQLAAEEVGITAYRVKKLCNEGLVPCYRSGHPTMSSFVLDDESMKVLHEMFAPQQRVCRACGRQFLQDDNFGPRAWCSEECRADKNKVYIHEETTLDSLTDWRRDAWLELQKHKLADDETWLSCKEALDITGLTIMQLKWLAMRGLIQTKDHPTREHMGTPFQLYALSQMKIVRAAFEKSLE